MRDRCLIAWHDPAEKLRNSGPSFMKDTVQFIVKTAMPTLEL